MEKKIFSNESNERIGKLLSKMPIVPPILEDKQFEETIISIESDTGIGVSRVIFNRPANIMPKSLEKDCG
jgi:hypothetical protein